MIEVKVYTHKHILVSELKGAFNSQHSEDFRAWFEEQVEEGHLYMALDFLDVEYISSMGISTLVDLTKLIENMGGKFVLFNVNYEIKNILKFLRLEQVFTVLETAENAIQVLHDSKKDKNLEYEIKKLNVQEYDDDEEEPQAARILSCPHCEKPMKLKKTGKYLCPHCREGLNYSIKSSG